MLIKEEKINLSRQLEFDVCKALAIVFMVTIHVYEELSVVDTSVLCKSPFDVIVQFLGGPLAAPLFMFSLGLGLSYSTHRTPGLLMKRGLKLLIFSYCYNLFRFTLPYLISIGFTNIDWSEFIYESFHIDILTFAGLAFILTGFLKKIKVPVWGVLTISLLMQAAGTILASTIEINSTFCEYFFGIFFPTGEPSYFPLLLWYIYPALGLTFAKYLRHIENTDKLYLGIFGAALSVLTSLCAALHFSGYPITNFFALADDIFYRQNILYTLFIICCVLMELSLVHFIIKFVHIKWLEKVILFMSNKLNAIYIVQWTIIGWLSFLVFVDDSEISKAAIIPMGLIITAISALIVLLISKLKSTKKSEEKITES